jgi:flagellin
LSFRINYNSPASNTQFQMGNIESRFTQSMSRLSSGLRLQSPQDSPAEVFSADALRNQITTLAEANRNVQDATNMSKQADANLAEVNKLLNNARSISVSAGNSATLSTTQVQSYQNELKEIWASINRIAGDAKWGSQKLHDGSAGIATSVTNTAVAQIGFRGTSYNVPLVSAPVTVQQTINAGQTLFNGDVAYPLATTIANPGSFTINGYNFTSDGVNETVQDVIDKVNAVSLNTGVAATFTGGVVELRSIEYGSQFPIQLTDTNGVISTVVSPPPTVPGTDAQATVSITTEAGVQNLAFRAGQGMGASGLLLSDAEGNTIRLTPVGNGLLGTPTAIANVTSGNTSRYQLGNEIYDVTGLNLPDIRTATLGASPFGSMTLDTIDLSVAGGPGLAIQMIDSAIERIGEIRGGIGSFQKYALESRQRTLATTTENFTASESALRDVDFAMEMTEFTKLQMLQQAGTSLLSQANQMPQQVLRMLES